MQLTLGEILALDGAALDAAAGREISLAIVNGTR